MPADMAEINKIDYKNDRKCPYEPRILARSHNKR